MTKLFDEIDEASAPNWLAGNVDPSQSNDTEEHDMSDFQKTLFQAQKDHLRSDRFRPNFCFDTFMEELTEDFEFMAKNEQKKLIIEGGEKKIYVSADKDKLEKIFNNLLSNAFKFTK